MRKESTDEFLKEFRWDVLPEYPDFASCQILAIQGKIS